jgi:hypothetical protein
LIPGQEYELEDFVERARTALHIASDRSGKIWPTLRFGFGSDSILSKMMRVRTFQMDSQQNQSFS